MGSPAVLERPRAVRPAQPALGKYANNSSPGRPTPEERQVRRQSARRERARLRYRLRGLSQLKRVRDCGHVTVNGDGAGPALRLAKLNGQSVAGLSGLATCGSVWACPVCASKIATRRAEELADVMRYGLEQGASASMVTLTMRHRKGQSLADCWDALGAAWARVTSGKQWQQDQQAAGLVGWVKAVEVTNGRSGWHAHLHVLMVWERAISENAAQHVGERMWSRWSRALQRRGFDSILRDQNGHGVGLDVRRASLDPTAAGGAGLHEYFVKLSHEITGGQAKLAKGSGRTPFQFLTDGLATGEAGDLDLWAEWEKASKGRRQMAWSKGLREWAKLMPEQSDEEIAAEELDGADLVLLPPATWRRLRADPDNVCQLLNAAEVGGFEAAVDLLDAWALPWLPGVSSKPYPPPLPDLDALFSISAY